MAATTLTEAIGLSNQIRPSTVFTTADRTQAVQLRIESDDNWEPISLPALLHRTVERFPDVVALRYKNAGEDAWQSVTYRQYQSYVIRTAKVFIKLGLEPHNSVGVLAHNSPEWFYSNLGAIHAGGLVAGIYTTNSPDAVHHVLSSSSANIVVVDDSKQMQKIRQIRDRLPQLKAVIQTHGPFEDYVNGEDGYYRWSDLQAENLEDQDADLLTRLSNVRVNECCCFVYTSGTVGHPKGVMLNHDSLTWCANSMAQTLSNLQSGNETMISYLPLSHIAAQTLDITISISYGITVYFADKDALKGSLIKTLHESKPTRFVGVPRVYEKIHEKMMSIASQTTGFKKTLATWAKSHTLQHWMDKIAKKPTETFQYKAARYLVMSRVKEALGLSRCRTLISAAAPMSPDLKRYFLSLDLPLVEAFGMSETSGAHCVGSIDDYNITSLGRVIMGAQTKIINQDEEGHGEILMKGRHIFMGYVNQPDKVAEAIDADGWLHSGDLGYQDDTGFMYITGRLKELIITAGGENIPPTHIENLIKKELPTLSNVFLVGDKRKYLTVLVTIKTEIDTETGMPKDKLLAETRDWLRTLDVHYTKLSEILAAGPCPKVLASITNAISRANHHSTSNAQKVQKFEILPHDFSVPTGELGPTLKVKRNAVVKMYEDTIEKLYDN